MITRRSGDIFETACEALVIPTNCVGVMGAGLAKQAALRYPSVLQRYQHYHQRVGLSIDRLLCYPVEDGRSLILLPTKQHWRDPSQLKWVDANLARLARGLERPSNQITSLALPLIGAGLGGLDRNDVIACVYHHLNYQEIPIDFYID